MSSTLDMPLERETLHEFRTHRNFSLGPVVRSLLAGGSPRYHVERRREQRYPFPYPIRLTPLATNGKVVRAESVVVLGKHLSEHGVDFYFNEPLPFRRAIATFERHGGEALHLLLELGWCRFGRHGWYENGGRFLEVLAADALSSAYDSPAAASVLVP